MSRFRSFVILAGMRTGSNLLEASLNRIPGVTCHGEAFNPFFLGWPDCQTLCGMSLAEREVDPGGFLQRLARPGRLSGFRYFHDHDPRIFPMVMADPCCAKIVLTRNPLESHVSTLMARETGQWKLAPGETPREARLRFDATAFRDALSRGEGFLARIRQNLQISGQSAFWLDYADLRNGGILTGLLHWLGRGDVQRVDPATSPVPQNPGEMTRKVVNPAEMRAAVAELDPFAITALPGFERARGPALRRWSLIEAGRGLVFMPVPGGPEAEIRDWLGGLGPLRSDLTRASLGQWKRDHPGHRSFAVLSHPLLRAWRALLDLIETASPELRQRLATGFGLVLPEAGKMAAGGGDRVALLLAFLRFLRRNLNGQTGLPTRSGWASQVAIIEGFAQLYSPDMLIREERLTQDLPWLAAAAGITAKSAPKAADQPDFLRDPRLIEAAHAAYPRDYAAFGFERAP